MNPGERFVSLSREIMRRHDQDPDKAPDEGAITTAWLVGNQGDSYQLQKDYIQNNRGLILMSYVLEYFSPNYSVSKPYRRYLVATNEEDQNTAKTSRIYLVDHKNLPMVSPDVDTHKWEHAVAQVALRALASQVPDYAASLVTQQFDRQFDDIVGSYILSDYAVEGTDHDLTTDNVAAQSVANFHRRTQEISDKVVAKAKESGPNGETPTTAYAEAVHEAAEHARQSDGRNRYQGIEYENLVLATATAIKKWRNNVTALDQHRTSQ